jgi:hypothetical protein
MEFTINIPEPNAGSRVEFGHVVVTPCILRNNPGAATLYQCPCALSIRCQPSIQLNAMGKALSGRTRLIRGKHLLPKLDLGALPFGQDPAAAEGEL